MKFAIIENNVIRNIIVAEQDFIDTNYPDALNVDDINCGVGWNLVDGQWVAPVIPEPVIEKEVTND
jgi:hypothetical protein